MRTSDKQTAILEFIRSEIEQKGYPPSVREICSAVGLKSTSSVHAHLTQLEKKGLLRRDPTEAQGHGGAGRAGIQRAFGAAGGPGDRGAADSGHGKHRRLSGAAPVSSGARRFVRAAGAGRKHDRGQALKTETLWYCAGRKPPKTAKSWWP